jgi:hypothetical protein
MMSLSAVAPNMSDGVGTLRWKKTSTWNREVVV